MTKKSILFILAIACKICFASTNEPLFSSCDGEIFVFTSGFEQAIIVSKKEKRSFKVGHSVDSGAIDEAKSLTIIYGTPKVIDAQYPQTNIISIFENIKHPKLRSRIMVGGGIYDASFSRDGKFGVVNYKYGTLLIDLKTYKSHLAKSAVPESYQCSDIR